MKESAFRKWLREIWAENCTERMEYKELPYSMQEYFQKYKYWLKREFKHQNKQG